MADVSALNKEDGCIDLPPGFRFHPTDEEIITHYLSPKVVNHGFSACAVGEVDLNRCEPWDFPSKAKMGEKEWYFFCQRDRKYPTGMRTNRATQAGYWKATGKDKEIFKGRGVLVGMKKTLVFYKGRAPKGEKTNWVMHEYRLEGTSILSNLPKSERDDWVVSRVFHKDTGLKKSPLTSLDRINSMGADFLDSTALPPLMDPLYFNSTTRPSSSFGNRDESNNFMDIPASFSSMMGVEDQQVMSHQVGSDPSKNSISYSQAPPHESSHHFVSYLHQEEAAMLRAFAATRKDASSAIRRHCKAEQYSNQSMGCPSQETGLSTDHNTEISSVVSKQCGDLDDPSSSTAPAFDLENFWKY